MDVIVKEDFKNSKSGLRCTISSSVAPITYYLNSKNEFKTISVVAKVHKIDTNGLALGTLNGLTEVNEYLCDIESKLSPLKGVLTASQYVKALNKIRKQKVIPRNSHFNKKSSDGKIRIFVQKGKNRRNTYQVFVEDCSVDKQGNVSKDKRLITASGFFEYKEDAEEFAEELYIEYETHGYYDRKVEHEKLKGLLQKSVVLSDKQSTFDVESKIDKEFILEIIAFLKELID